MLTTLLQVVECTKYYLLYVYSFKVFVADHTIFLAVTVRGLFFTLIVVTPRNSKLINTVYGRESKYLISIDWLKITTRSDFSNPNEIATGCDFE